MRAFIAITLPQEIKDYLASVQNQLKASGADVKWVQPKNIHLTLKFLGERDDKKIEKIMGILEDVIPGKPPFEMRITNLGAFPGINSPRVIWAGLDLGDNETRQIASELEEKICAIGIPKEDRPFSSHITIGRVKSDLNHDKLVKVLTDAAGLCKEANVAFQVTKVTLFKSTLTSQGPVYETLKEVNLQTI